MANAPPMAELLATLRAQAMTLGLTVYQDGAGGLSGELDSIRSRWFLGGRGVTYQMSCRLDEVARGVHFRESVTERSWRLPPPMLTRESRTVEGWQRSGTRSDRSAGGGTLDYACVRDLLGQVVSGAGWQFRFEGGRKP